NHELDRLEGLQVDDGMPHLQLPRCEVHPSAPLVLAPEGPLTDGLHATDELPSGLWSYLPTPAAKPCPRPVLRILLVLQRQDDRVIPQDEEQVGLLLLNRPLLELDPEMHGLRSQWIRAEPLCLLFRPPGAARGRAIAWTHGAT